MVLTQPSSYEEPVSEQVHQSWAGKAYRNICEQKDISINRNHNLSQLLDLHATKVCSLMSKASRRTVSSTVGHLARANWDRRPINEDVLATLIAISYKQCLVMKFTLPK